MLKRATRRGRPWLWIALVLALDQQFEQAAALPDSRLILRTPALQRQYVVPGARGHAAVDGHWPHRCMRKDEAQAELIGDSEFRHHRLEIMPVCAEPMQPDNATLRVRTISDLDRLRQFHTATLHSLNGAHVSSNSCRY